MSPSGCGFRALLGATFILLLAGGMVLAQSNGQALLKAGKADEALQALQARIQKNSEDAEAYNLISRVYLQLEEWDEAVQAGEKSVVLEAGNAVYHQWLGRAYGQKADAAGKLHPVSAMSLVRKVKAEFERAVALDQEGTNLSAQADLAEFYMEAPSIMGGNKSKARKLADVVMTHDPALAHYLYGRIEEKMNAKEKAEEEYKTAIEASGQQAGYWVSLASFYRRSGRRDEMQAAVKKSLAAPVSNGIAVFDGASLLVEAGSDYPTAIQMLRLYLGSEDPDEDAPVFQAHYLLGKIFEKQKERQNAATQYRAALKLASHFRPAQEGLARVSR